jgi:hypothetical protein
LNHSNRGLNPKGRLAKAAEGQPSTPRFIIFRTLTEQFGAAAIVSLSNVGPEAKPPSDQKHVRIK